MKKKSVQHQLLNKVIQTKIKTIKVAAVENTITHFVHLLAKAKALLSAQTESN